MIRIVAVIPSHLASVRFPGKILHPFHGLPMIEHVRRRALLASGLDGVYVATCDEEIAQPIRAYGGDVVLTSDTHRNGTSRVSEAVAGMDCTHVLLLQGDEPLLLPRHVEAMIDAIREDPDNDAWNATAPINEPDELDRHSFVKCAIDATGRILYAFRRTPSVAPFGEQQTYIRKILGLIAFRKDYMFDLAGREPSIVERHESIEQMRIVENGGRLVSVPVAESLPSVNEPDEAGIVLDHLRNDAEQAELLARILK